VTIAAKPVVTPLNAVIDGPTVAVYLTWRTFHMLLAAALEVREALPVQLVEFAVLTVLVGL
jgi:hypothetical protein